jgi:hypothetical protein
MPHFCSEKLIFEKCFGDISLCFIKMHTALLFEIWQCCNLVISLTDPLKLDFVKMHHNFLNKEELFI